MKKLSILSLVILTLLFSLSSCTKLSRQNVMKIVEETKKGLPKAVSEDVTFTDINIKENMIEITCKLSEKQWNDMQELQGFKDVKKSDRYKATLLSCLQDKAISSFVNADYGVRFLFYTPSTEDKVMTVDILSTELAELYEKIKNGKVKEFSVLDYIQMDMEKTEFPIELNDEFSISEGYVKGKNVCYVLKVGGEMEGLKPSPELDSLFTELCTAVCQETEDAFEDKLEIMANEIHLVYILKNSKNVEISRVDFGPKDLMKIYLKKDKN